MSERNLLLAARDRTSAASFLGSSSSASNLLPATSFPSSRTCDSDRVRLPLAKPCGATSHDRELHAIDDRSILAVIEHPGSDSESEFEESSLLALSPPPPLTPSPSPSLNVRTTPPKSEVGSNSALDSNSPVEAVTAKLPAATERSAGMECASSASEKEMEAEARLTGECRICQEEDILRNLDSPCTCAGSLKYAHPSCLQQWCNEKTNTMCEICHQPYKASYTVPEPRPQDSASSVLSIEIRENRAPDGTHSRVLTLRDTVTGEETRFDLSEPDETPDPWAWCKGALLIVFMLMLLPKALMLLIDADQASGDLPDDPTAAMLRMIAVGLPLLILLRVMHAANDRQRHQEELAESETTEAAAHVAFLVHARHAHLMAMADADSAGHGQGRLPGSEFSRPVAYGVV